MKDNISTIAAPILERIETTDKPKEIGREYDPTGFEYMYDQLEADIYDAKVLATTDRVNLELLSFQHLSSFVNLKRLNDVRFINKFLETVNAKLETGGSFIGCFESNTERRKRIFNKFNPVVAYPFYLLDFIWKRVFPKLPGFKKVYFALNKGHNRVISTAEVLGRLVCCGFEIVNYEEHNNKTYFHVKKVREPYYDDNPTYGPVISLSRKGYRGEWIDVYKFRTMHPYSEYLQQYVYSMNGTSNGDKIINDFRITAWGKYLRKFWLDELPMFVNYFKGELKLVGVRPLSRHKFNTYPEPLQEKRVKVKPGLVPPFYVDLPDTVDEFHESERKYLDAYMKHPIRTDFVYFFRAIYNILIKRARSK